MHVTIAVISCAPLPVRCCLHKLASSVLATSGKTLELLHALRNCIAIAIAIAKRPSTAVD
eukprot:9661-Heterococcus_DN1.PRE.2